MSASSRRDPVHRRRIRLRQKRVHAGRDGADRLARPGHRRVMRFNGTDLLSLSPRQRRRVVGKDMAMVFQEPMSSLNPCYPVGWQIAEALRTHHAVPRHKVRDRVVELLDQVGIPAPATRLGAFPHQLSGGMNQRVMIAMAIACNPQLLIADEPTTALDVTIQKQILDLLVDLQRAARHGAGADHPRYGRGGGNRAPGAGDVRRPDGGGTTDRRRCSPPRGIPTPRRCSLPCPSAPWAAPACPPSPAWSPASTTARRAACSTRAAGLPMSCRTEPPLLAGPPGRRARCHYPLGTAEAAA